jgi:hypothetical protein
MLFPSFRSPRPDGWLLFLLLRLGIAFCFIGHGAFGFLRKEAWLSYFDLVGIGADAAYVLMLIVGTVDVVVGILALVWPARVVFAYAAVWALATAALRPLAGEGVWEMAERAGNYGVPFAVLLLFPFASRARTWFARLHHASLREAGERRALVALRVTAALLLAGHGVLALQGKPLLLEHGAIVGAGAGMVQVVGGVEILAAVAILLTRSVPLLIGVALWKLTSEALFVAAGAPVWEWIERGGSYVAPLAAAWLILRARQAAAGPVPPRPAPASGTRKRRIAVGAAAVLIFGIAPPVPAQAPAPRVDAALLARLQAGGLILACRHAETDADAPTEGERFSVRPINPAGERQAVRMGELIRALGIPIGEVLSSPYLRNMRTAELAFGRAEREDALWTTSRRQELRPRLFSDPPASGNRVLMTHQGVLYGALPVPRNSIPEGDCVVIEGRGAAGVRVLGQASNGDWERLLAEHRRAR